MAMVPTATTTLAELDLADLVLVRRVCEDCSGSGKVSPGDAWCAVCGHTYTASEPIQLIDNFRLPCGHTLSAYQSHPVRDDNCLLCRGYGRIDMWVSASSLRIGKRPHKRARRRP